MRHGVVEGQVSVLHPTEETGRVDSVPGMTGQSLPQTLGLPRFEVGVAPSCRGK